MSAKTKKHKKNKTYTQEDFNSGDGMLTAVWGPAMWHFLHTMSFNYPVHPTPEQKHQYLDFVKSLVYVLPCKYCRMNLKENLKKMPLTLDTMASRESFSRYIYKLHEHVNTMLKKKSGLSYEDVQERYEHFRARCLTNQLATTNNSHTNTTNPTSVTPSPSTSSASAPAFASSKSVKTSSAKGCTEPLFGKKSKCLIQIVPIESKRPTLTINKQCIRTRHPNSKTYKCVAPSHKPRFSPSSSSSSP